MRKSLLDKVWDLHRVAELPSGETQLFVGLHLVHEVTSPQAFAMLSERGLAVRHPELTVATAKRRQTICRSAKTARPPAASATPVPHRTHACRTPAAVHHP